MFIRTVAVQCRMHLRDSIRPLDHIWAGAMVSGKASFLVAPSTTVTYIHTLDYDLVLALRASGGQSTPRVVFIDSMGPLHPNYLVTQTDSAGSIPVTRSTEIPCSATGFAFSSGSLGKPRQTPNHPELPHAVLRCAKSIPPPGGWDVMEVPKLRSLGLGPTKAADFSEVQALLVANSDGEPLTLRFSDPPPRIDPSRVVGIKQVSARPDSLRSTQTH